MWLQPVPPSSMTGTPRCARYSDDVLQAFLPTDCSSPPGMGYWYRAPLNGVESNITRTGRFLTAHQA